MKRLFTLFALLGVFSSQVAYASFSDVKEDTPYLSSIEWMQENGVVNGKSKGLFQPKECLTRAESLVFLYKSNEVSVQKAPSTQSSFADVASSHWAYDYIEMAKQEGLIQGFKDGNFRPNDCMSRAEAISLALNYYLGSKEYVNYYFYADYRDIPEDEWFSDALGYALDRNLVGVEHQQSSDQFEPQQPISRGEAAELIYRLKTLKDNDIWYYQSSYHPYPLSKNNLSKKCAAPASTISSQLKVESVAPTTSEVFFTLNQSDPQTLENLKGLLGQWPSPELNDFLQSMWKTKEPLNFLGEKSEFNFALDFPNDFDWSQPLIEMGPWNFDLYTSGTFEDPQAFMDFIAPELQKSMPAIECSVENDVLYWTSASNDFYMAIVGKYFFATNTAKNREDGLERLRNQSGYKNINSEKLMSFSANMEDLSDFITKVYQEEGLGFMATHFDGLEYAQSTLSVEQKGFRFASETRFRGNKNRFFTSYQNAELNLINHVSAENVVMYQEDQDLSALFESIAQLMNVQNSGMPLSKKVMPKRLARELSSSYELFLTELTKDLSLSPKELDQLLESPYALALSDVEGLIPGISFYLDINEEQKNLANRFSQDLDAMIDEFIAADASGAYVRENLEGTDLRRVTISNALDGMFETLEFNYGVSPKGDYVFALYPNFAKTLTSTSTLAQDEGFQKALRTVKARPARVEYININALVAMVEEGLAQMGDEASKASFAEVKPALAPFEFMVNVQTVKNNSVFSDGYLGR